MSIWSSLDGDTVDGLNYHDEDANYRAQGEPTVHLDFATAISYHDHARLEIWSDDDSVDADVILSPAALRQLAADALRAADYCEQYGYRPDQEPDHA